ncbi:PREDICTED: cyclin N-terminal domain-containing protein 1-like [Amphimedon queenslandica]|uniref:Cyclin N-terminal domain-containing protein n=1 Tax=Amphimedon queenslandica TaxID=400682 RepID=A0A1X7UM16_AMPQE|nr:PREDICTED: cyclin N-terminal domain-containing protein 1-like [Amphimedon queenslandica]|eukprot:XP_003387408.1 PREDICTED: cyclin N-terminal domain-containing protein 1-like [Amphimedon queenslandica]
MRRCTHNNTTRAAALVSSSSYLFGTKQVTTRYNKKRPKLEVAMEPHNQSLSSSPPSTSRTSSPSIFASPPEPLFNQRDSYLLLEDSLLALSRINTERVSGHSSSGEAHHVVPFDKCQGVFRTGRPIAHFMRMSHYFNLPPDIRCRAIELFHSFMSRHVCELYLHVQLSQTSNSPISWESVESRLAHQVSLRALTCLQLASKLSLHYKIINLSRARNFLAACGFRYAPSSLIQSEIRILKTLDYRINGPTPLDFIEVLLEALGHYDCTLPVKQFHGISVKILDAYYLSSSLLHDKIRTSDPKTPSSSKKEETPPLLELNYLLLASGIVGASAFILDQCKTDGIVEQLADITRILKDDIINIVALLLEHIMTD